MDKKLIVKNSLRRRSNIFENEANEMFVEDVLKKNKFHLESQSLLWESINKLIRIAMFNYTYFTGKEIDALLASFGMIRNTWLQEKLTEKYGVYGTTKVYSVHKSVRNGDIKLPKKNGKLIFTTMNKTMSDISKKENTPETKREMLEAELKKEYDAIFGKLLYNTLRKSYTFAALFYGLKMYKEWSSKKDYHIDHPQRAMITIMRNNYSADKWKTIN